MSSSKKVFDVCAAGWLANRKYISVYTAEIERDVGDTLDTVPATGHYGVDNSCCYVCRVLGELLHNMPGTVQTEGLRQ